MCACVCGGKSIVVWRLMTRRRRWKGVSMATDATLSSSLPCNGRPLSAAAAGGGRRKHKSWGEGHGGTISCSGRHTCRCVSRTLCGAETLLRLDRTDETKTETWNGRLGIVQSVSPTNLLREVRRGLFWASPSQVPRPTWECQSGNQTRHHPVGAV